MAAVRTIMVYQAGSTPTMFACTDGKIYDVTAGGNFSTAAVSGLSGNDFIWTNFATSGGNFLVATNGADAVRNFDGSSWSSPSITGVTSATLNYVFSYKSMLWFLRNSSSFAYALPVDSVAGTVTALNVGAELSKGGTLVAGASLTQDAGEGPDDYAVFLSSEGEVVVFAGSDPRSAETWAKVGTYQIGRPIGRRCLLRIGGDVAALTQDGVVSLTQAIQLDRAAAARAAFTSNIRKAFADQYKLTGSVFGWQAVTWPQSHMALVNVPIVDGVTYYQFVMNVLTGAWCRFLGVNAVCWALANDSLYFGTPSGRVMQFGETSRDDGKQIDAACVGAFTQMNHPGQIKHVKMTQVFTRGTGRFNLGVNMARDFTAELSADAEQEIGVGSGSSVWDQSLWDLATWSVASNLAEEAWLGVAQVGHFLAPVVLASVDQADKITAEFISENVLYEPGAVVG